MKFLFLMMIIANSVFAGNEGGGGGAVVCRDERRQIVSAELLDLYEAEVIHELQIQYSAMPYEDQIESALERLKGDLYQYYLLKTIVADVKKKFKFLPNDMSLNQPADVGENTPVVVRDGCLLEGVGFYTKKEELLVARKTFEKFSETDKAAFILHEAIYKLYRHPVSVLVRNSKITSVLSREMTARLFASNADDSESQAFFAKNIEMKYYAGWTRSAKTVVPKLGVIKMSVSLSQWFSSKQNYKVILHCSELFSSENKFVAELRLDQEASMTLANSNCSRLHVRVLFNCPPDGDACWTTDPWQIIWIANVFIRSDNELVKQEILNSRDSAVLFDFIREL